MNNENLRLFKTAIAESYVTYRTHGARREVLPDGLDLENISLRGKFLGQDIRGKSTINIFSGEKIFSIQARDTSLARSQLSDITMVDVDLAFSSFYKAEIDRAFISEANLDDARFIKVRMQNTVIDHSTLRRAKMNGSDFSALAVFDSDLSDVIFDRSGLEHALFNNVNLTGVSMLDCNLRNIDIKENCTMKDIIINVATLETVVSEALAERLIRGTKPSVIKEDKELAQYIAEKFPDIAAEIMKASVQTQRLPESKNPSTIVQHPTAESAIVPKKIQGL